LLTSQGACGKLAPPESDEVIDGEAGRARSQGEAMRERDRELKRRRHRRTKQLKKRSAEDAHRIERSSGSKRAIKKPPAAPAEASGSAANHAAVAEPPAEAPKKKPAAKKAPAKKAPAPPAEVEGSGEGGPEEPPQGA
jgi:hypothetical protein